MVALPRSPDASRSAAVAVGIANLLPLVGVVALGWDATTLVTVYWFELGVVAAFAVLRGVFAGRPSGFDTNVLVFGAIAEKRLSLPVPRTGVRVHLSSLFSLAVLLPFLAVSWAVTGPILLALAGAEGVRPETVGTALLAATGIAAAEALRTAVDYFHRGGYRDESAGTAVRGVLLRMVTLLLVGFFVVPLVAAAVADDTDVPIGEVADPTTFGPLVLGIAVLVKFAFDLAALYGDRLVSFDESTDADLGWAYDPPNRERDLDPGSDPDRRLRPTAIGRVLGHPLAGIRRPGGWVLAALLATATLLAVTSGETPLAVGLGLLAVTAPVTVPAFDSLVRYGPLEYRIDDDDPSIVAYDRLSGGALWRIEPWDEEDLRVERDRIDRRTGTRSVVVELRDREIRLPRLADPGPVLDAFDRRAERPDDGS
ncbi:DUF6498-containing protein [Halorubrum tebenquichense]|uniref:Uncharacterized protein n=1 Tax=Halorubrum tebenquichense DSM 14210 TaxID=1227485 RepID=M0DHI6_9EURY|nr:DUF6498-containing protein [Halorubrum tebenquichense]ELZ34263.1 hypothetical protein C472_13252 [Halorubrum tebenquichense DSM 14210]